jgi:hypothetical protein
VNSAIEKWGGNPVFSLVPFRERNVELVTGHVLESPFFKGFVLPKAILMVLIDDWVVPY